MKNFIQILIFLITSHSISQEVIEVGGASVKTLEQAYNIIDVNNSNKISKSYEIILVSDINIREDQDNLNAFRWVKSGTQEYSIKIY